jgi:hypothetical protein
MYSNPEHAAKIGKFSSPLKAKLKEVVLPVSRNIHSQT